MKQSFELKLNEKNEPVLCFFTYKGYGDFAVNQTVDLKTALKVLSPLHLAREILEQAEQFEHCETYAINNNKAMTPEWAFQIDQNIKEKLSLTVFVAKRLLDKVIGNSATDEYNAAKRSLLIQRKISNFKNGGFKND